MSPSASATASSSSEFTNANPEGCSPTITLITPCGGVAGTVVAIVGTNLLKSSGTATTASVGGDVRFFPYKTTATHTGTPDTPRQLTVVVPSDADDGRIRVSTFNDVLGEGAVLGFGFIVRPPDFDGFVIEISRSVTLRLERSVVARGVVSADNGFTTCAASVPVKIQRFERPALGCRALVEPRWDARAGPQMGGEAPGGPDLLVARGGRGPLYASSELIASPEASSCRQR
jgi:hypothetical protein